MLFDARRSAAGDEEEDLVVRIDEVEQLSSGFETRVGDVRMSTFNDLRFFHRPSIAGRDCNEGIDIIIEPIAQRSRALANGDDGAQHVGRRSNEPFGCAGVESAEVDRSQSVAHRDIVVAQRAYAFVAPSARRRFSGSRAAEPAALRTCGCAA